MSVRLKILLDGTESSLEKNRLSLRLFAVPLQELLKAFQVTASRMLSAAMDDSEYGSAGGRRRNQAMRLDLELANISGGCAELEFEVTYSPLAGEKQLELLDSLPERVTTQFLEHLDEEQQGNLRSANARRYLRALPPTINKQRYIAKKGKSELKKVEFNHPDFNEDQEVDMPTLENIKGKVVAVGFEKGKEYVSFKTGSKPIKANATIEQVETALEVRNKKIEASIVVYPKPKHTRLIWIRRENSEKPKHKRKDIEKFIYANWSKTLQKLSE